MPEPQGPFSMVERDAVLAFVAAGGGLFMVADHENSDRDCDGWDSPRVWNDFTGATSATATGVFGIWFRENGVDDRGSEDWFDDGVDANVETDPADPIIEGPFGSGRGGLGLFGATSMELGPADNPTVRAHVWRTGAPHGNSRVTFATASHGSGRVAAVGDSSPADDNTGDPGDRLYPGWNLATGGVANRELHLNACEWLLNPAPDVTPPVVTAGPFVASSSCSAVITWTTDESASSTVEFGDTAAHGRLATTPGFTRDHAVTLAPLAASSTVHFEVVTDDPAANGPTRTGDATFGTLAAAAPVILSGPSVSAITGTTAVITWTTDSPSSSLVEHGPTAAHGSAMAGPSGVTQHVVALSGLTPTSDWHYRVISEDACGALSVTSADDTFTTGPAATDISGWRLQQYSSSQAFVFPAGTLLPSGGYAVVARNASRASFEAFFPGLPAETLFLDSNASGSCASVGCVPQVNGGETYELYDASNVRVDGLTVVMTTNRTLQRRNPGDPAGSAGSWRTLAEALADPGAGAGTPSGAGIILNEIADAADYTKEYVELFNDTAAAVPDTTPPAPIMDLTALPVSGSSVRLEWTATGDDDRVGTATSYDVRYSASPLLSHADFNAATAVGGAPPPAPSGTRETLVVSGLTADTAYWFAAKVADEVPNVSELSNADWATTALVGSVPGAAHLVISQVQTAGGGATPADDEFIELHNPTALPMSLAGLSLQYKSAAGTTHLAFALPAVSVAPQGWFLVARSAYDGTPAADVLLPTFLMGAAGGNLFLVNGTAALPASSCSTSSTIIDRVAYGTGNCPETAAAAAPSAGNSIVRRPGGAAGSGQDTDDNASDFASLTPSMPRSSGSAPATPPASLGNVGPTLFLSREPAGTLLDWANAAGATAYRVYRSASPDVRAGAPPPFATPAMSRLVDATAPAPVLCYWVLATDGTNESAD